MVPEEDMPVVAHHLVKALGSCPVPGEGSVKGWDVYADSHVSSLAQWFFKCLRLIEEEMCDEWNQDKVGIVWIQRLGPGALCCLCVLDLCPVWPLWFDIFWARIPGFTPQPSMFGLTHEHLWLWCVVIFLHWMNVTIGYHRCFSAFIVILHLHHSAWKTCQAIGKCGNVEERDVLRSWAALGCTSGPILERSSHTLPCVCHAAKPGSCGGNRAGLV